MAAVTYEPASFSDFAGQSELGRISPDVQMQREKVRLALLENEQRHAPDDVNLTKELSFQREKIASGDPFNRGVKIAGELKKSKPTYEPMTFGDTAAPSGATYEPMFPEAKPATAPKPKSEVMDTVRELGRSIWEGVTVHTAASIAAAYQGMDISDEGISGFLIDRSKAVQQQRAAEAGADRPSAIPGISIKDVRDLGQNLGFSLTAMGAGLAAGIPATIAGSLGTPAVGAVAGYGAGMGAAGKVAYNMDVNQVTRQLKEAADEESQKVNGRPQTPEEWQAKLEAMKGEIQKHGLYEAIPEALGSGAGFAILTTAAKIFGKGVIARFSSKLGALYGEEMLTETVTQIGQQAAETRMGLHPGDKERSFASPEDWLESAKEVAPQVFLLTTLMGGGVKAGQMAYQAGKGAPEGEPTTPPEAVKPAVAPPEQPSGPPKALGYQAGEPLVVFPDGSTMTRAQYEQERADGIIHAAPVNLPPEPLSSIDQARADAQILKAGQNLPEADETRLKNATLLSVYGENAAVRHVIEQPDQFGSIAEAMLAVAPTVERVRGAIGGRQEELDITPDILGAIDELAQGVTRGQSLSQAMAQAVAHDISYEGQQMMAFLDENSGNPQKIATFLENYLHEIEQLGGVPSEVRGRAFDIIQERGASKKKAEEQRQKEIKERAFAKTERAAKSAKVVTTKKATEQHAAEKVLTAIAVAKAAGSGVNAEHVTAIELAFRNAKKLKGKPNAKPSAESGGAVPTGTPSAPKAGGGQGEAVAGRRAKPISQPDKAVGKVNAQPAGKKSDQRRAAEKPVNRGAKIAGELKAKTKQKSQLFAAIKEMGGIASSLMRDLTGESNAIGKKGMRADIFRKKGPLAKYATTDLSWIAERLKDRGYAIDTSDADGGADQVRRMIADEMVEPGKHVSGFDEQAVFDRLSKEREQAEMAEAEAVASAAALKVGIDWSTLTDEEKDAEFDRLAGTGTGPENTVAADQGAAGGIEAPAPEARPEVSLETQTEADLAAKAARENDQAATDRARIKRESEAAPGAFTLQPEAKPASVANAEAEAKIGNLFEQRRQVYNPDQAELIYENNPVRPGTTPEQKRLGILALDALFGPKRVAGGPEARQGNADRGVSTLLGSALWRDFQERAGAELIGQQAGSASDLALAAQILRDPRFETLRVFFVKDGKIVGHTGWTSRLPGSVSFSIETSARSKQVNAGETGVGYNLRRALLKHEMENLGADGYYMLHNHPSGSAKPSRADEELTAKLAKEMPGFLGHVVIDHNEYASISRFGSSSLIKSERLAAQKPVPEVAHDTLGMHIEGPSGIVAVGKMLQVQKGYATLVATNAVGNVQAIAEVPEAMLTESKDPMSRGRALVRIRKFMNQTGSAGGAFIVAENPERFDWLIKKGSLTDAVGTDGKTRSQAGILQPHYIVGRAKQMVLAARQMAWHGSPHTFDEFKLQHIGSGEGAQAYGWGMYFAGAREVAEFYRGKLSNQTEHIQGVASRFLKSEVSPDAARTIQRVTSSDADVQQAARELFYQSAELRKAHAPEESAMERHPTLEALVNEVRSSTRAGRLYQVELAPKESDYLDWDKPLSEQSEKVKTALATIIDKMRPPADAKWGKLGDPEQFESLTTGQGLYQAIAREAKDGIEPLPGQQEAFDRGDLKLLASPQELASRYLNSIGIPGIKYLDASSRNMDSVQWKDGVDQSKYDRLTKGVASNYLREKGDVKDAIARLKRDAIASKSKQYSDAARALENGDLELKLNHNYVIFDDSHVSITGVEQSRVPYNINEVRQTGYRNTARRIVDRIDQVFNPLGTLLEQKKFLIQRGMAQGLIEKANDSAKEMGDVIGKASQADNDAIIGYWTTAGAKPDQIADQVIRAEAVRVKKRIGEIGDELVEAGMISKESRDEYRDAYLPRLYLKYLLSDSVWKALGSGKIPSDMGYRLARNKNLSKDYREIILGQVTDARFLAGVALAKPVRDMALLDWLNTISLNENWVMPGTVVDFTSPLTGKQIRVTPFWLRSEADRLNRQARHQTPEIAAKAEAEAKAMEQAADDAIDEHRDIFDANGKLEGTVDDFKQIPNTPRFGRLRGLVVRKEIYDDLMGTQDFLPSDPGWFQNVFGYGGIGTTLTQIWKGMKVAMNPPSQVRNFVSNGIATQLFGGVPLRRLPSEIIKTWQDILSKGKYYDITRKHGVGVSTFAAQEVFRMKTDLLNLDLRTRKMGPLGRLHQLGRLAMGHTFNKAGDWYQFSEMLFKTTVIRDAMENRGMSEEDAVLLANDSLFDYSLVTKSVRYARNAPIGIPFLVYQIKVLPRLVDTILHHPQRFLPWIALFYGFPMMVASMWDVDDDDLEKLKKSMPEWLRDKGHAMILPRKDDQGRWQAFDAGYMMPWSMWTEAARELGQGEVGKAFQTAGIFGGPVTDIVVALKTGKDPFTKRDIWQKGDPPMKQWAAITNYAWNIAAPPILTDRGVLSPMGLLDPAYGGKLVQASTGTTNKWGEPRSTYTQALMAAFGMNIYAITPEYSRAQNVQLMAREMQDVGTRMRQQLQDRSLSEEQRKVVAEEYSQEIVRRANKLKQYMIDSAINPKLATQ